MCTGEHKTSVLVTYTGSSHLRLAYIIYTDQILPLPRPSVWDLLVLFDHHYDRVESAEAAASALKNVEMQTPASPLIPTPAVSSSHHSSSILAGGDGSSSSVSPQVVIYEVFSNTTCYDLMQASSKGTVFETTIPFQLAFFALIEHGNRIAPASSFPLNVSLTLSPRYLSLT